MHKKKTALVSAFALLIFFASFVIAQQEKKRWDKTVTLPSGEVVLDMRGEWDYLHEGYGAFSYGGTFTDILTITQDATMFTAVKQIGSHWVPKGAETIKGELDKDGFKAVYHYIKASAALNEKFVWAPCKWKINENGNKVVLDCGGRVKATLTRR